jgi:hypothetical protein
MDRCPPEGGSIRCALHILAVEYLIGHAVGLVMNGQDHRTIRGLSWSWSPGFVYIQCALRPTRRRSLTVYANRLAKLPHRRHV